MSQGFKHDVSLELMKKAELSYLESREVAALVFKIISEALLRHEEVYVEGFGTFRIVRNPETRRMWKFGEVTICHQHRYKVVFEGEA